MSFSTLNPVVGPVIPVTRANGSHIKWSSTVVMMKMNNLHSTPSQVLKKETFEAVSRREIMCFAGASLAGVFSLSSPGPAEAKMTKTEMKNKILEKLKELRERFGLPKQKDEITPQTEEVNASTLKQKDEFAPQTENIGQEEIKSTLNQKDEYAPQEENKSTPKQKDEIAPQEEKESTPKPKDEYAPQTENIGQEEKEKESTPKPKDEYAPQTENISEEERKSTPKTENEGGEESTPKSPENEAGEDSSEIPKESPMVPFLSLSEIEPVEATLKQ